jgi:hypothetical protein
MRPLVTIVALCAALGGCHSAARENENDPDDDEDVQSPPEVEVPLEMTLDGIAVRHGELRITGSFDDGSPDVSLWTWNEHCEKKELGHGIATRTGFVWSLASDDLQRALECNLIVRVRTFEEGVRYRKEKMLGVAMSPILESEETVKLVKNEIEGESTRLGFRTNDRVTRLHVGPTLIGAEPEDDDAEHTIEGPFDSDYLVPNGDLARVILSRKPMSIAGVSMQTVITVHNLVLDLTDDLPPIPEAEPSS